MVLQEILQPHFVPLRPDSKQDRRDRAVHKLWSWTSGAGHAINSVTRNLTRIDGYPDVVPHTHAGLAQCGSGKPLESLGNSVGTVAVAVRLL